MDLLSLLARPPSGAVDQAWFTSLAQALLQNMELVIRDRPHRLREVEFYYQGPGHQDPFAHGHPMQKSCGRWYLHREGSSYRGGSFKGLDLSFGPEEAFGGILIRSLSGEGAQINGSCLCVEHMLRLTGYQHVSQLDEALGTRQVTEPGPIYLRQAPEADLGEIWSTPRVGLTLKRAASHPTMPSYLMRPYRFLHPERWIKKGRACLNLAMLGRGMSPQEVGRATGSPVAALRRLEEARALGVGQRDLLPFFGRALKNEDLARLHGMLA